MRSLRAKRDRPLRVRASSEDPRIAVGGPQDFASYSLIRGGLYKYPKIQPDLSHKVAYRTTVRVGKNQEQKRYRPYGSTCPINPPVVSQGVSSILCRYVLPVVSQGVSSMLRR